MWRGREKTSLLLKKKMEFLRYSTFNRWIRHDRRIIFVVAVYQNFVLSLCKIIFPFSDHRKFYVNFSEILRKFLRNFTENSRKFPHNPGVPPHTPPTPPPLPTHMYNLYPYPHIPTSNWFFSKFHFQSKGKFFPHPFTYIHTYSNTYIHEGVGKNYTLDQKWTFLDIPQVNWGWSQDCSPEGHLSKYYFLVSQYRFPVFGSPYIL